jgi:hypothetical protein
MVSRSPAVGLQAPLAFDGASLGTKDIKQIDFWQNGAILQDISIVYTDSSVAGPYGFGINKQKTDSLVLSRGRPLLMLHALVPMFTCSKGEFITDVFVWSTPNSITSLQFAKNTSQVSGRYGVLTGAGDPTVCNMAGRALLGLSGSFTATSLTQLQASRL